MLSFDEIVMVYGTSTMFESSKEKAIRPPPLAVASLVAFRVPEAAWQLDDRGLHLESAMHHIHYSYKRHH